MPRAQFRDSVMLRWANGLVGVPAVGNASLFEIGTTTPIADTIYADISSPTTLPNPLPVAEDGTVEFWLDTERDLDLVINSPGYTSERRTIATDAAIVPHALLGRYAQLLGWSGGAAGWQQTPVSVTVTIAGNKKLQLHSSAVVSQTGNGTIYGAIGVDGAPTYPLCAFKPSIANDLATMTMDIIILAGGLAAGQHTFALWLQGTGTLNINNSTYSTLTVTQWST
jgi:hypothetical protein